MANKTMNIGNTSNQVDVKITGTLDITDAVNIDGDAYLNGSVYATSATSMPTTIDNEQIFWVSGANGSELTFANGLKWLPLEGKIYYDGVIEAISFGGFLYGDVGGNATSADQVNNALTVGDKTYNGSATVTISAADLGLSSALKLVGSITDSTLPSASGYEVGNVVLFSDKEYVCVKPQNSSTLQWEELGAQSSHVLKTSIGNTLKTDSSTGLINVNTGSTLTVSNGVIDYKLPTATSSVLGGIKIGSTLTISNGVLNLPTATSSVLGGVKIGSTLTNNAGVIDYKLPVASNSALGGVMVGSTLTITTNGALNVRPATSSTIGGIKAGNNVTIASDGTLSIGGYLPLTGGTMTGDILSTTGKGLKITGSGEITGVSVTTTNNSVSNGIALKALADGTTGLWDTDAKQWIIYSSNGNASTQMPLYGAVWNDYAEFRRCYDGEAGRCVVENGDDTMCLSTKRLQYGGIISDTFGFVIGDKNNGKPIAVSGRVLAYTDKDRKNFKPGDAVCSGPHGTVSKMTRKEIKEYPEKILGVVSAVPTYEFWGPKQVPVDGRVWIKVR